MWNQSIRFLELKVFQILTAFLCYINSINFDKRPNTTVETKASRCVLQWLYTLTIPPLSSPPFYTLMPMWTKNPVLLIFTLLLEECGTHQPFSPCFLWSQRITVHVCKFCFIWPQKSFRRCRPEDCDFDPLSLEHTFNVMYCRKLFYFTLNTIDLDCFTICRQFFQSELADS